METLVVRRKNKWIRLLFGFIQVTAPNLDCHFDGLILTNKLICLIIFQLNAHNNISIIPYIKPWIFGVFIF